MKVHLRQIPPHGLHLEGEEDAATLELDDPNVQPLSALRYTLDVGLSEGGLFATGQLAMEMQLQCVGCLEAFPYPMRVDDFAMQTELGTAEVVDLTPYVREDTLLALPPHPRCDWNGERACPGVARRTTDVSSESHAWDELDKLKLKQRK